MNGFVYQRRSLGYITLREFKNNASNIEILEEGNEDIDVIKNNEKFLYQIKYHKYSDSMSLTKDRNSNYSELMKIIRFKDNWENKTIREIHIIVYSGANEGIKKLLLDLFNNKDYITIRNYYLIIESNITFRKKFNNRKKINDFFNLEKKNIKKRITNIDKDLYNFFINDKNVNEYFSKFEFHRGYSYDKLNEKILNLLKELNPDFDILDQSDEFRELKLKMLFENLLSFFEKQMMENDKDKNKRKLNIGEVKKFISNTIKKFKSTNDLLKEFFNSIDKGKINNDDKNYVPYISTILDEFYCKIKELINIQKIKYNLFDVYYRYIVLLNEINNNNLKKKILKICYDIIMDQLEKKPEYKKNYENHIKIIHHLSFIHGESGYYYGINGDRKFFKEFLNN